MAGALRTPVTQAVMSSRVEKTRPVSWLRSDKREILRGQSPEQTIVQGGLLGLDHGRHIGSGREAIEPSAACAPWNGQAVQNALIAVGELSRANP